MNDFLLSVVYIFAELGVVLLLVAIGLMVRFYINSKKETKNCNELIAYVKTKIQSHHSLLDNHFKDLADEKKASYNVEALSKNEKTFYERLIKVSISKEVGLLKLAVKDLDVLINSYFLLLPTTGSDADGDEHEDRFKKENSRLRERINTLEVSLKVSNDTLENMLSEMSAMYEGGQYEDDRVVKEKVYKLKESLGNIDKNIKEEKAEIEDIETGGEVEDFNPEENIETDGKVEDFNLEENIETDGKVEDFNLEENIETDGKVEDFNPEENIETDGKVEDFNLEENIETDGKVEDFNLEENTETESKVEDINLEENIETDGEVEDFNLEDINPEKDIEIDNEVKDINSDELKG